MSSHTIANYLVEIAANYRKINYCREILASNHLFNPNSLFQKYALSQKTQITIKQFQKILQDFSSNIGPQQNCLIFTHFQVDSKQYLTYDQFYDGLVPQDDQSLRKLINKREKYGYEPDYSVKYALNKLFIQIYDSQLELEFKANFEIEPDEASKKAFKSQIGYQQVQKFMGCHDKYPTKTMIECIRNEVNKNKGQNNRNMLIRYYILKYLRKMQLCIGQLPNIVVRMSKIFAKLGERKPDSILIQNQSIIKRNSTKSKASGQDQLNSSQKTTSSILGSIHEVENNIKNILTSVSLQPSPLSIQVHKQNFYVDASLTHQKQLQSSKINNNKVTSSIIDSITPKPTVNQYDSKAILNIKSSLNTHEGSAQRINRSVNKQQGRQQSRHQSSSKYVHKYSEDELEYRYRRFNYLKQDRRSSSKRKQTYIHQTTTINKFPF